MLLRRIPAHRSAASVLLFLWLVPSIAIGAGSVTQYLNVRDTKIVTRAEFIKAVVSAAALPLVDTGSLPYDKVPPALAPYVRAAHGKNALQVFASEGKSMSFTKGIRRGEALAMLVALLQPSAPSRASLEAAQKFTDLHDAVTRTIVAQAIEQQWMKAESSSVFGYARPLRGKEGTLLLGRAFALNIKGSENGNTETLSIPVIRVQVKGMARQPLPKQDLFEQVWNTLRQNYLYTDKMDPDTAGDKAIEGLVNSLGDPYTVYMPKVKNDDFKLQMKGEVEGIGATVEMTGGILTIVSPIRSSPAEKAGLQPKDQILSVDGESLMGLTLDDAVRKVRGPKGSTAVLRIRRGSLEFDVSVLRDKVVIPEVEITYDQNIAVVKIVQFWDTTDTKFRDAMSDVQTHNVRGIILDLRSNPGGLLHAAGVVVSNFVPRGSTFVNILERDATNPETTDADPTVKNTTPMIVLVNRGSASASEIVAGALQDAKRAKIVGQTTYGKGTVQQVVQFTDGSSLKYTIAEWRTPLGRKINKVGIEPDVVISNEGSKVDLQMQKAMELLR